MTSTTAHSRWFRRLVAIVTCLSIAVLAQTVLTRGETGWWSVLDNFEEAVAAALATLAAVLAYRRQTGSARRLWKMLAIGTGLWFVGQSQYCLLALRGVAPSTPAWNDLCFLPAAVCMAFAVLSLVESPARGLTRLRAITEGALISVTVLFASWTLFLDEFVGQLPEVPLERVVLVAYPSLDVVVITVLLFSLPRVRGAARAWIIPLAFGIGSIAVADSAFLYFTSIGYDGVAPTNAFWTIGLMIIAVVAFGTMRSSEAVNADVSLGDARSVRAIAPPVAVAVAALAWGAQMTIAPRFDPDAMRLLVAVILLAAAYTVVVILENAALSTQLRSALEEALQASKAKSEFLSTVSHELRTPMNAVIGLTDLLLDTSLDETQHEFAVGVAVSAESLLETINGVLDFSKIEAGEVEVEVADFDIGRVVGDVTRMMSQAASTKGLVFSVDVVPGLVMTRQGDSYRLRQILLNLVANAVKFTPRGQVALKVTECDHIADGVRFDVVDTGIGFDSANSERLLQPFSQADASTTRRYGGTGLGLAIVDRLTRMMGGTLEMSGVEGVGSTFSVALPLPLQAAAQDRMAS